MQDNKNTAENMLKSEQAELTNETNQQKSLFTDAIKVDEEMVEEDSTMDLEKSNRGKFSWNPNEDPTREFKTICVKQNPTILRFGRNSANEKEGLFLAPGQLKSVLDVDPSKMEHGLQITVVLTDTRAIRGYFVKTKTRRGAYFPHRYIPAGLKLPTVGTKLPVRVAKLIIG